MQKLSLHSLIVHHPAGPLVFNTLANAFHELRVGHDLERLLDARVILIGEEHGDRMTAARDDNPIKGLIGLADQLTERFLRLRHRQETLWHGLHLPDELRWMDILVPVSYEF